jgi:hypothetical protein
MFPPIRARASKLRSILSELSLMLILDRGLERIATKASATPMDDGDEAVAEASAETLMAETVVTLVHRHGAADLEGVSFS